MSLSPEGQVEELMHALNIIREHCVPYSKNSHGRLTALGVFQKEVNTLCKEVQARVDSSYAYSTDPQEAREQQEEDRKKEEGQ